MKKTIGMGGFTLAEVLITLGIIGVVAAMTMPTLINSTQGAQYKTAFKKALTVLSQAVVMNIALNDYDLSQTVGGTNMTAAVAAGEDGTGAQAATAAGGTQSVYELFKNRLNVVRVAGGSDFTTADANAADYYKIIQVPEESQSDYEDFQALHMGGTTEGEGAAATITGNNSFPSISAGGTWPRESTLLFMNDGITFIFDNTQANCAAATKTTGDHYCFGFIDVNGQKSPNRVVQCDNGTIEDSGTDNGSCTVSNPTDIYPIAFYDQSVIPASSAARAVLYAK